MSIAPLSPSSQQPAASALSTDPLQPRDGRLWVVRWLTPARGDAKHRYYRRRHDALTFIDKLADYGRDSKLFVTDTTWSEVDL